MIHTHWRVVKRMSGVLVPYAVAELQGNLLLNEGINEWMTLLAGGSATAYNNANTYIGVGNGTTTEDATQTGLQGGSTAFADMDVGFPTYGTNQQIVWQATFDDGEAEFRWEEFTVVNAATDAGENLLRKVGYLGTKSSGMIWALTVTRTLS